jgi:hypothetical protein
MMSSSGSRQIKKEIDLRTKGIINNFALRYPVEPDNAAYVMVQDVAKDPEHDVQHEYAFELVAMPFEEKLLRENSQAYASIFIGAINWSVSPGGIEFEGDYSWKKKKGDYYDTEASDVKDVLEAYGFSFFKHNTQSTKIPCVIYGNLQTTKPHYIGQSKAEVDTSPYIQAIIKAVKSVARDIPTFRVADIPTPDMHVGVSSSYVSLGHRRSWKEPKPPKPERKSMFDVVYKQLKERIEIVKSGGGTWTGELHTQNQLWYMSLPLIRKWVDEGRLKKPKNRENFLTQIRKVCDYYKVEREEVGVMAGAYSSMFYNGKWSAVNFADIELLATMGVAMIFIEKQDVVQTLGPFASRYGVALINTKGHLSEYAKDLSRLAIKGGAKIAILTDYDIPGLHIASKLKGAVWLGIDKPMLQHFNIELHDTDYVIPYDPAKGIGDKVIKRDIESDKRFNYPIADISWLKQHKNADGPGKIPGNKVEIDAVLAKAGAEEFWKYLMNRIEQEYETFDYNRVIDVSGCSPSFPEVANFVIPRIVNILRGYGQDRYYELIDEKIDEWEAKLEDHEGLTPVSEKENEIRGEFYDIVKEDDECEDIKEILHKVGKSVESRIREEILSEIKKLDEQKHYGLMAKLIDRTGGSL